MSTLEELQAANQETNTRIQELKREIGDLQYENKLMNNSLREALDNYVDVFREYRSRTNGYIEMVRFQLGELLEARDHYHHTKRKTKTKAKTRRNKHVNK